MHQWDVAVSAYSCLGELLLALLGRLIIPVPGIDIVGDDAVSDFLSRWLLRAVRIVLQGPLTRYIIHVV